MCFLRHAHGFGWLDPHFGREAASQGGMAVSAVQAQCVGLGIDGAAARLSFTVETTMLASFAQRLGSATV
jgi:hypothetical protein